MSAAGAGAGWPVAAVLVVVLARARRRLELVAQAEHELRGPLAAISLGVEALGPERAGAQAPTATSALLEAQLDRVRAGLADLAAAQRGRHAVRCPAPVALEPLVRAMSRGFGLLAGRAGGSVRVDWRAGAAIVRADRSRVAQALGNVLANAVEHGGGDVRLRGLPVAGGVRIEIEDRGPGFAVGAPADGRGRGLSIAARAVEDAGGALSVATREHGATVALELPLAE